MYAIIGLGNPDKKYDKTRHNVGFDVIDELARQMAVEVKTYTTIFSLHVTLI